MDGIVMAGPTQKAAVDATDNRVEQCRHCKDERQGSPLRICAEIGLRISEGGWNEGAASLRPLAMPACFELIARKEADCEAIVAWARGFPCHNRHLISSLGCR